MMNKAEAIFYGIIIPLVFGHFFSCSHKQPQAFEFHIMVDQTSSEHKIEVDRVVEFISSTTKVGKAQSENQITVQTSYLNEFQNNRIQTLTLPIGDMFMEISKERVLKQEQFFTQLANQLHNMNDNIGEMQTSMVTLPICDKLHKLSQAIGNTKQYLLIFSDLLDNDNKKGSFYAQSTKDLEQYIEQKCELPKLPNLTIYIVYQPNSKKKDKLNTKARTVWRNILTPTDATVFFKSNL